jgi:hypothetical protein
MFSRTFRAACAGSAALGVAVLLGPIPGAAPGGDHPEPLRPDRLCDSPLASSVERDYAVSGRIRLLLFWTGRHEVGQARYGSSEAASGARRLELLIGTDPAIAPRHLNRWGYEAETVCGSRAELLGIMTQSDEESIDDATATLSTGVDPVHPFKAIRARQSGAATRTEIFRVLTDKDLTYRDVNQVLDRLPPPSDGRVTAVPAGTDSGFLVAVTALLNHSVATYQASRRPTEHGRQTYIYAGRLYVLTLRDSHVRDQLSINGVTYAMPLESEFQIRNTVTGDTTDFQITYGTDGDLAGVPLRIVYRPHWWLEVELTYQNNGPSFAAVP